MADTIITSAFARELLGEASTLAAQARLVMMRTSPVQGVERTFIGGVILEAWTPDARWARMDGTLIFVPRYQSVLKRRRERGYRLDQMVVGLMNDDAAWTPIKAPEP
jgi:hypothetical protein